MTALQWLAVVFYVPLLIVALPFLALWGALDILYIHLRLLSFCAPHGERVLFAYSNSPNATRFWQPFRAAKHGKPQNLERLKSEFLTAARTTTSRNVKKTSS